MLVSPRRFDILLAPNCENGKSDNWYRLNESRNEVSTEPDDDNKLVLTMTDDITICSDEKSSLENKEGTMAQPGDKRPIFVQGNGPTFHIFCIH
jgi:hypothetical protein